MFNFCPSCGSRNIRFDGSHAFSCPDCGFRYYHNTAAATGCIIRTGERILFLLRGKEPALGKLDVPGGFVNPGEGAVEGLRRELREEIGWEPPSKEGDPAPQVFKFLASFPNIYPYRGIIYHTCDLFFTLEAPDLKEEDLRLEKGEIGGVRFLRPGDIRTEDLAFDSTRRAVRAYLAEIQRL